MSRKPASKLTPACLTGIPGIDSQHNEIFLMFKVLLKRLVKKDISLAAAYSSVEEIMKCLKSHCSTEEHLLDMIGFPKALEHKTHHKKLLRKLNRELKIIESSKGEIGCFARTLWDIVRAHILDSDREYAIHIENLISMRKKYNITALKARVLVE